MLKMNISDDIKLCVILIVLVLLFVYVSVLCIVMKKEGFANNVEEPMPEIVFVNSVDWYDLNIEDEPNLTARGVKSLDELVEKYKKSVVKPSERVKKRVEEIIS